MSQGERIAASTRKKLGGGRRRDVVPVGLDVPALPELTLTLTSIEEAFARHFALQHNATNAYILASGYDGSRVYARTCAWEMSNRPHVLQRVRQYESAAAAAVVIDYAAILEHDRAIVEGYKYVDQISQHIWQCCRYCLGVDHKYQWIDLAEYIQALQVAIDANAARLLLGQALKVLPDDAGGYGYRSGEEPSITCPQCEGRGVQVTLIADTTKLTGPARVIVKGVKTTAHGSEVLLHDIDKAKDRLLRAGGMYGDDAASVARGAAAGAAAGAIAGAKAVESMTAEQAQRLYLELA